MAKLNPSLSEPSCFGHTLRKGNKADFFNTMKSQMDDIWIEMREIPVINDDKTAYGIDMMAFIQRHQYRNCKTFSELYEKYFHVIVTKKSFPCDIGVLVGDRYDENHYSVKEIERTKRKKSDLTSKGFEVQDNIEVPKWQQFFNNNKNKALLLRYISKKLCTEHSRLPNEMYIITAGMAENNSTTTISCSENTKITPELNFS